MFEKTIANLRKVDLEKIALKELKNKEDYAVALNTDFQLFERGIDSKGESLGVYSPFTIREKIAKGLPHDRVTLFDEGGLYAGWIFDTSKFPATFWSTDSKADMLADKYGDDIFGLIKPNVENLSDEVNPEIIQKSQQEILKAIS